MFKNSINACFSVSVFFFCTIGPAMEPLPIGNQFMIELLIDSLMADHSLEDELMSAINVEMNEQDITPDFGSNDALPLLHLVRQLISNSISRNLSHLNKVSKYNVNYDIYIHLVPSYS